MKGMYVALVIAALAHGAHSPPPEPVEKVGWWTLKRALDPAAGKLACAAQHVGGAMTMRDTSLTVARVPWHGVLSGGVLEIAFDGIPLTQPLNETAGVGWHFGVLTLEGAAFAKAMESEKMQITLGSVDAVYDMRGASQALQMMMKTCQMQGR